MSWKTVKLGEVCEISNGGTPKSKVSEYWGEEIQWLTPKDMGKLNGRDVFQTERQISRLGLENSSAKLIPQDSIILSCRAPIGHIAINKVPMSFNQGCKGLVPSDSLSLEYLYFFLFSSKQLLNDLGTGTTFKEISGKTLSSVSFPLPPLAEQERIVAKLDAAFAAIDQGIALAEKKEAEVEQLKAALLSASLAGDDWKTVKLGEVCEISNGGTPKSKVSEYWGEEIQWLTPKDMGKLNGRDVFQTERQISRLGLENSSAKLIPQDSIILSCRAPIGHIAINKVPMSFNQGCKGLVPSDSLSLEYLYFFLFSSKQLLNDLGTGTTFKEISGKTLSSVSFPLPPLAEQERIVAKLDAAFAELETARTAIAETKANYQALKAAILAQELQPKESEAA